MNLKSLWEILYPFAGIQRQLENIRMDQAATTAALIAAGLKIDAQSANLVANTAVLGKVGAEIQSWKELAAELAEALKNANGTVTPALEAATLALTDKLAATDTVIADLTAAADAADAQTDDSGAALPPDVPVDPAPADPAPVDPTPVP